MPVDGNDSSQIKTHPTDGRGLLQNERKEKMKKKKKKKKKKERNT